MTRPYPPSILDNKARVKAFFLGDDDGELFQFLLDRLDNLLRARLPTLSTDDRHDAAIDAIYRVFQDAKSGRLDFDRNVLGYLYQLTRWRALDASRRQGRHEVPVALHQLPDVLSDDDVAAIVEANATAAGVRHVLDQAARAGDRSLYKVATYALDASSLTGRVPSNREIAAAVGLSHTGVAKVLARLRRLLADYAATDADS
jgi:hypothetical protein